MQTKIKMKGDKSAVIVQFKDGTVMIGLGCDNADIKHGDTVKITECRALLLMQDAPVIIELDRQSLKALTNTLLSCLSTRERFEIMIDGC